MPPPVPDAPLAIVIHDDVLPAVHVQVGADAVTATVSVAALASIDAVSGEIEKVHGVPACEAVNAWPAIVAVPLRGSVPPFAAYDNATVPLPVPLAADAKVIHGAFDAAVQAQVGADAVTVTEPLPPAAATFWPLGEIVNVHGAGAAAAWLTVKA